MHLTLTLGGIAFRAELDRTIDLSIPIDFDGPQPHAFGLPRATSQAVNAGDFVGDTRSGGSCNCETVTLNPHGSGTHTECAGHVTRDRIAIADAVTSPLVPCTVISVEPHPATHGVGARPAHAGDRVVSRESIERALVELGERPRELVRAIVVRTVPNDPAKRSAEYTGTNPPYLTVAAMHFLRELGVEHLVVDLPSVDREDDGGRLAAHRAFFDVDDARALRDPSGARRTITEMAYVPESVADGAYVLCLQIPPFVLDAAPSRPILVPLTMTSDI
jgi:kynurenine formamidase